MGIGRRSSIGVRLRTLGRGGAAGGADDRALLARYTGDRDDGGEEAFRLLLERHWPMVLRVCRQVISQPQDAEDAAQAVFLVLARKAPSLRVDGTLAPWLCGVARRVAARARGRGAARRRAEARSAAIAEALRDRGGAGAEAPGAEDREIIQREVDLLPEKYRTPIILCYLQGLTYEQAAGRIGCPVGTVRVRLSRARERLRVRLARRGFGPERVAAIGGLMPDPGSAPPPAAAPPAGGVARLEATVKAARALSMGRRILAGTVPASAVNLYEGVVPSMTMNRWIGAAGWLLAAGMAGAGAIGVTAGGPGGPEKAATSRDQPPPAGAPHPKAAMEPPIGHAPKALRHLVESRVAEARRRLDAQRNFYREGRITPDRFIDASLQLMLAEMAASATKDQRTAAAKANLDRIAEIVKREQAELKAGRGNGADVAESLISQENATDVYLEVRQGRDSDEVEILRERIRTLEQQVESLRKQLARTGTDRR